MLAPPERRELKRRARKRSLAVELVKRAEVILMLASGLSYREILERLDRSDKNIGSGRSAFKRSVWQESIRVIGIVKRRTRTAKAEPRILETTRQKSHRRSDPLKQLSAG